MSERPYTVLSCCTSLDGYIDDSSAQRLVLSGPADLDRVDDLRSDCDAILVGAGTVRADDPRLLVRSANRRARRIARGMSSSPTKVTVTSLAKLDPECAFFTAGDGERLVYCATDCAASAETELGQRATVVDAGCAPTMTRLVADLHARGVRRLLVEGGACVFSQFLAASLADELQLAVAPFFVGDPLGRRFVDDRGYPWTAEHRARLVECRVLEDVVLLRYALSHRASMMTEPAW